MKVATPKTISPFNIINEHIHWDFMYAEHTYAGVLVSSLERLKKEESTFLKQHEKQMKQLNCGDPFVIIKTYQKNNPDLLNDRVCMTQLITDDCFTLGVIWYDDGTKDIKESFKDIYEQIDWTKSKEFDY